MVVEGVRGGTARLPRYGDDAVGRPARVLGLPGLKHAWAAYEAWSEEYRWQAGLAGEVVAADYVDGTVELAFPADGVRGPPLEYFAPGTDLTLHLVHRYRTVAAVLQKVCRSNRRGRAQARPPLGLTEGSRLFLAAGPAGSGVHFHQHPESWSLLVHGAKRRWTYPANRLPPRVPIPLKHFARLGQNATDAPFTAWVADPPCYSGPC